MTLFNLRYDLRCPDFATATPAALYAAALEQCGWADRLGFASVTLSEHHGSPDGYLPSPIVMAAAIAARTENIRLLLAAVIAPLHDPIRIAEDLAVLDQVSRGRLIPVFSGGYVESEFRSFGRELAGRARAMEAFIPFLKRAWTGEPFEYQGRSLRITPRPHQRPRPPLWMGGGSAAAARRAARLADHFLPTTPAYFEIYRKERVLLGKPDPGPLPETTGNFVHVALDPDAAWEKIAPHALHETNAYGRWMQEAGSDGPYQPIEDADALRARGDYLVLRPEELVEKARAMGPMGSVLLHTLMGGMDPELSWESLRLIETQVLPALRS
ncbi:MAG: LLM class flavin-dependent oxidoreductase [Myxococcota bacterium]